MPEADINYWAVLVSALAFMVLGAIYYMPSVLGNAWTQAIGKTPEQLKAEAASAKGYILTMIGALVASYVMAHFVDYAQAGDWSEGLTVGFWAWLGFVATTSLANTVFAGRSTKLYLLDNGYHLLTFLVAGAILAGWA